MIGKKDVNILSEFVSDKEVADDVNLLFPIDSEDNIRKSLAFLLSEDVHKVYSSQEQLDMLNKILDKSKQFNNDFLEEIKELAEGGRQVEKLLTEADVKIKAEELTNAAIAKKEDKVKFDSVSAEVEALKTQIAELTKNTKTQIEDAKKVEKEKTALETQLADIKDEQKKTVLAETRIKELDYDFGESRDYVVSNLKTLSDEDFDSFKKLLETVAKAKEEKAEEDKTEEEKAADKEKAEAAKKNLAKNSEEVPNNTDETDKFEAIGKALSH